ncbi:DMT family transporter [Streptomyces sp. NBC_00459]|uniref:DMT family transporter n=1 Tax=Streptomyces sp. NBC_00459 TaxID=2975749 RepID=UPI002E17C18B
MTEDTNVSVGETADPAANVGKPNGGPSRGGRAGAVSERQGVDDPEDRHAAEPRQDGGRNAGLFLGATAVLSFSVTLPATRVAVGDMNPWFVAFARMLGAGILALAYLMATRAPLPRPSQVRRLLVVATGVVVGFPVFSSLALTTQTASHGAVVTALLPTATAIFAVLRGGERPGIRFWCASSAGLASVLVFVVMSGSVDAGLQLADVFLLLAVIFGGLGYAEGGVVARELGGARTICWALVLSLPLGIPLTVAVAAVTHPGAASPEAWLGLGYVVLFSMFLGFFAWYAGLARGGVARVGQLQLAQPVLTLGWSVVLLGEAVDLLTLLVGVLVLIFTILTQRTR